MSICAKASASATDHPCTTHTGPVRPVQRRRARRVRLRILRHQHQPHPRTSPSSCVKLLSPEGGKVSVDTKISNDMVEIRVSDEGPGIRETEVQKVFYPFYTTKSSGSGLGLAISKNVIDAHNGTIKIEKTGPRGTVFFVAVGQHHRGRPRRPRAVRGRQRGARRRRSAAAALRAVQARGGAAGHGRPGSMPSCMAFTRPASSARPPVSTTVDSAPTARNSLSSGPPSTRGCRAGCSPSRCRARPC